MKIQDVEIGGYYTRKGIGFVMKVESIINPGSNSVILKGPEIEPSVTKFRKDGTRWMEGDYLKVTPEEIAHLEACIKAQVYIPVPEKPPAQDNYLTFN